MEVLTEETKVELIGTINSAIDLLEAIHGKVDYALSLYKCRQLQMVAVDLSSIADHIQDLATNGPTEPWSEIPLEQSETAEAL
jgi:hypothetical protein